MSETGISAATRISEIKSQAKTVFEQADQRFAEIYREKLGQEPASAAAPAAETAASAASGTVTDTSALADLFGSSGSSGDMSSILSAMMLSGMTSGLTGTSSGGSDMSSMLMMYMLMNQMQNGSQSSCSACTQSSAVNSYAGAGNAGTATATGPFEGAEEYISIVQSCAEKYDVPANLILSVMKVESGFKNGSTSSAGAQGLMQLMPGTAKSLGVTDVMDPAQNIEGGTKYLRKMLDMFGGDVRLALAAYNTGPGNVKKHGSTFEGQTAGVQGYVNKVLGYAGMSQTVAV